MRAPDDPATWKYIALPLGPVTNPLPPPSTLPVPVARKAPLWLVRIEEAPSVTVELPWSVRLLGLTLAPAAPVKVAALK